MTRTICTVALSLMACTKSGGPPTTAAVPPQSYEIPMEVFRGIPFVKVTDPQGEQHLFMLDTGASYGLVDTRLAEAFAVRPYVDEDGERFGHLVTSSDGSAVDLGDLHVIPELSLGGLEVSGALGAYLVDLEILRRMTGREVVGLLGFETFSALPMTIDYPRGVLVVHERLPVMAGDGLALQESDAAFHPLVDLQLGDQTIRVLLDTGSGSCMQVSGAVARAADPSLEAVVSGYSMTASGVVEDISARLDIALNLGDVAVPSPIATLVEGSPHIGGPILNNFAITFDPASQRVWLVPSEVPEPCAPVRSLGFYMLQNDAGQWQVALVHPAAEGGQLDVGDGVLEIEGRPIAGMDMAAVGALWDERDEVEVVFRKGEKIQTMRIPVRTLVR